MSAAVVYVVDGDPAVRDSLSTLLDLNGYEVRAYATGGAFLGAFGQGDGAICVICEARLPDSSGVDLYRELGKRGVTTPFALMVSRRNDTIVAEARAAGITSLFQKPLVYRNLLEFVGAFAVD